MKLETVQIENFRSIEDSTEFTIDPVTCLVGKNESGKTALLQALNKLHPVVDSDSTFDDVADYPRHRATDYEEQGTYDNVLTTKWSLDNEDREALAQVLGTDAAAV